MKQFTDRETKQILEVLRQHAREQGIVSYFNDKQKFFLEEEDGKPALMFFADLYDNSDFLVLSLDVEKIREEHPDMPETMIPDEETPSVLIMAREDTLELANKGVEAIEQLRNFSGRSYLSAEFHVDLGLADWGVVKSDNDNIRSELDRDKIHSDQTITPRTYLKNTNRELYTESVKLPDMEFFLAAAYRKNNMPLPDWMNEKIPGKYRRKIENIVGRARSRGPSLM